MSFLSSLLFVIFLLTGLYFLFNEGRMIGNPLVKGQKYFATGHQLFLIFTIATGMFMLGEYSAIRLLVWIAFLLIGIIIAKGRIKFTLVSVIYILYILYLLLSLLFLSPDRWYGIRVIAKYIFPLFVLIFATKVTTSEFVVFSGIKCVLFVAIFVIIRDYFHLYWILPGTFWPTATLTDHLVVLCAIVVALFYITSKKIYLLPLSLFLIFPIINTIRTGLVGISVCLSVLFIFKYKWKAVPIIVLIIIAAISVVLYIPSVREKMFREQLTADEIVSERENLTINDIDTSGRQAMWAWSLKKFYESNKIWGAGVGNLQKVFYSLEHPFGTIKIVHNDYVQILSDTGLVGLILYLLIGLCMLIHSFLIYHNKQNNEMIKLCAIVAGSSIVGVMTTSYTDNAVNYTLATYAYPFAFYGMALGLLQKYGR